MTMILNLPPEVESALAAKAARLGVAADACAIETLAGALANENGAASFSDETKAARDAAHRACVRAAYGKYAGTPGTVDDFLRERHQEAVREMEKADAADAEYRARHAKETR